ncbi:site-specific integrase [Acidocella sp.]|uniref:tyrosine-type recombinase/integrase n=1 Tax=Acidocella sp. TaxID=50710 RepID=UPI002620D38E|nr:site-specific integrase [Acidocella sp.]
MRQKLTKTLVDSLACPPGRRDVLVFDSELTGFAVRVTETGAKRFLLQFTRAGRTKRLPLGKHGEITVYEARQAALVALGELAKGGDPVAERDAMQAALRAAEAERRRAQEADAFTVDRLLTEWAETGLRDASERHRQDAPRAIRRLLAPWLHEPARALTQAQAQQAVDALAKTSPVMASRVRAYARTAFGWAARRRFIPESPFAAIELEVKERSRERVLTDTEIGEIWRAAGNLAQPWGAYFRVLLLTLQRKSEVAGMHWAELNADGSLWTVPAARAKNKKAHIVHLSAPVREALAAVPRLEGSRLVFTTNGKVPIAAFTQALDALRAEIAKERAEAAPPGDDSRGLEPVLPWTMHDFRRTGVTVLAGLGFAPHVADRLLNHVQGAIKGVAAVYQRQEFLPERERAMTAWAQYVLNQAAGVGRGSNVVRLRKPPARER